MKERTINEQSNHLKNVFKIKPVAFFCILPLGSIETLQKPPLEPPSSLPELFKYILFNEKKLIRLSSPHFGMSLYA